MIGNINREIQDKLSLDKNSQSNIRFIGEIWSNKNLGLNTRVFSTNTTLDVSDAFAICTGAINITLPPANSWSTRDAKKSPIITILCASLGPTTILPFGADVITGTQSIPTGRAVTYMVDGASSWYAIELAYLEGTYTPTISAGTGTFTSVTGAGEFTRIGNRVFYRISVDITTNGTAATQVIASLPPFTPVVDHPGCGAEDRNTLFGLSVLALTSGNCLIRKYDGTYPGANGNLLLVEGHYRV